MKNNVSVIIPFYNEAENIPFLTESLNAFFSQKKNLTAEVIFVNDGSRDNSLEVLKGREHKYYDCKIISLSRNFGSHAALRAGIQHAEGSHICFIYADLQDPLELVERLYNECAKGNDICWASRESAENGLSEKLFSRFYSGLMKKFAMPNYPDKGFDIVMFNGKVQEQVNKNIEANSSVFLQILSLGFRQASISYQKQARKKGKSKWTVRKKIKLFVDSFVAFSFAPIRLVTITGILLFFAGLMWSAYLIIRKIIFNDLETGWPALVSILMIGFGITNISLGIIAEYLWRTLDSSRKRPVFIIDDITHFSKHE